MIEIFASFGAIIALFLTHAWSTVLTSPSENDADSPSSSAAAFSAELIPYSSSEKIDFDTGDDDEEEEDASDTSSEKVASLTA